MNTTSGREWWAGGWWSAAGLFVLLLALAVLTRWDGGEVTNDDGDGEE